VQCGVAGICAPQGAAGAQKLGTCQAQNCGGCGALGEPLDEAGVLVKARDARRSSTD
jgi:hypothetical protein